MGVIIVEPKFNSFLTFKIENLYTLSIYLSCLGYKLNWQIKTGSQSAV